MTTFRTRRPAPLHVYVTAVIVAGWTALGYVLLTQTGEVLRDPPTLLWVLLGCVLAAELVPVKMVMRGREGEVVTSTALGFALLLAFGPGAAVPALALGAVFGDVARRKPLHRMAFNVGQYSLAMAVAGLALWLTSDIPRTPLAAFTGADLPQVLVAAALFFCVNTVLVTTAVALAQGHGVWKTFVKDFFLQASTAGLALGLSPVVTLVGQFSLLALPLLALPLIAVHRGSRQAVVNEHQALHDALTGLPNRVLFKDRVTHAIESARRKQGGVVVMLMDLDHFKEINDTLGHHHGDRLLELIGRRLEGVLRAGDTVARLGGDEFAICLPGARDTGYARHVAEKCLEALRSPFEVDGLDLEVGASIGIACYPEHGDEVETLIQRADIAMYVAKTDRGSAQLYRTEQDRHSVQRLALVTELRRAIEKDELVLHFQPQVSLATRRFTGAEALTRWQHPTRGLIMPDEFVPVAEATGLITQMTSHVLRAAVAQIAAWRAQGLDVPVAVNLSARSFLDGGFLDDLPDLLAEFDVPGSMLGLELTESMIVGDPNRVRGMLEQLAAMGVMLAIDDFGTGYSSLAYLKQLPVHEIKIDRSFVLELTADTADVTIVRSIIDLAHNLGLRAVAEGVEDEMALERLAELGCDVAQGYLIARPLSADRLARWLTHHAGGRVLAVA